MHIALINSRQDPGGVTIRRHLLDLLDAGKEDGTPWRLEESASIECIEVDGRLIFQDHIDDEITADCIFFISRHSSTTHPVPALTVHVTGNYGAADLGGAPRTLAPAAPAWMYAILRNLSVWAPDGYRVSYEVTHHGPTMLHTPSLFVEIGSTEAEWNDSRAGIAAARSILEAGPAEVISLIGFGGTHYATRQTEISLRSRGAFGHIAPTRTISSLDQGLVAAMRDQSGAVAAYVDRKALSGDELRHVRDLIREAGLIQVSERDLMEMGEIPWETYVAITDLADRIAPGSRVFVHRLEEYGEPVSLEIQADLLSEVLRCDEQGFLEGLDTLPIVHLTGRGGRMLPVFITYENYKEEMGDVLICLCVKLLVSSENTLVMGDRLVIRRSRFDPGKAHKLGIEKGPLFGKLAAGNEVTIDGHTVSPEMVQTISTKEIQIAGLERYL